MKTVKEILDENELYGENAENVLHAAAALIDLIADKMEELEPYATNAIARLRAMESQVYHLPDDLREYKLIEDAE